MEVAGNGEVLILVAGEDSPLEVDHEPVSRQEVGPEDGLLEIATSKFHVYLLRANCRGMSLDP